LIKSLDWWCQEEPGLPRQAIPDSALLRTEADSLLGDAIHHELPFTFIDPNAGTAPVQFYRVVVGPPLP
jgi:hypothetical protein